MQQNAASCLEKKQAIDVTAKYARLARVVVPRARQTAERASMRRAICKMYSYEADDERNSEELEKASREETRKNRKRIVNERS